MKRILILTLFLSIAFSLHSKTIRVRLFTGFNTSYTFFSVTSGSYIVDPGTGTSITLNVGDKAVIARYSGKIAIRIRDTKTILVDSLIIKGVSGDERFSLRINSGESFVRSYSGDLSCYPDFGSLLLINTCDIETYIAGVVKAEGGGGKNSEYFKTQAVIARTYTYKYYNKHLIDRYNLCDDTHCQAFSGIITDSAIINAAFQTRDLVITTADSTLIISAFHSNCGGETSPSEYAWLTEQPYLIKVVDPYCITSRNSAWEKTISIKEWLTILNKNGYQGISADASDFVFSQPVRVQNYVTGRYSVPLRIIRDDLGLRSSFFSVSADGDSIRLTGKGYGHGVGLCQEGAMVMASKGFHFSEIINFYYKDVKVINISNVKKTDNEK